MILFTAFRYSESPPDNLQLFSINGQTLFSCRQLASYLILKLKLTYYRTEDLQIPFHHNKKYGFHAEKHFITFLAAL